MEKNGTRGGDNCEAVLTRNNRVVPERLHVGRNVCLLTLCKLKLQIGRAKPPVFVLFYRVLAPFFFDFKRFF